MSGDELLNARVAVIWPAISLRRVLTSGIDIGAPRKRAEVGNKGLPRPPAEINC